MAIAFRPGQAIKMRDLLAAEASNSAAVTLMAQHAVDKETGQPIPYEKAAELIGDMSIEAFYAAWIEFNTAMIPKVNAATS